jgi:hypothetical protein
MPRSSCVASMYRTSPNSLKSKMWISLKTRKRILLQILLKIHSMTFIHYLIMRRSNPHLRCQAKPAPCGPLWARLQLRCRSKTSVRCPYLRCVRCLQMPMVFASFFRKENKSERTKSPRVNKSNQKLKLRLSSHQR